MFLFPTAINIMDADSWETETVKPDMDFGQWREDRLNRLAKSKIDRPRDARRRQQHLRFLDVAGPDHWQEKHSPSIPIEVRISNSRVKTVAIRRAVDARLFDSLDNDQLRAAEMIYAGYNIVTTRVAVKAQNFEMAGGGRFDGETPMHLVRQYRTWINHCRGRRIATAPVLDVIVFGKSLAEVDRSQKRQNGWTRKTLGIALDLYAELQGWKRSA